MFEKASRMKLRFETKKGNLAAEDLWDLPLTSVNGVSLDDLAKFLNRSVKENEEESFVIQKTKSNAELELKFNIVKHVISTRLSENEAKKNIAEKKAKKEKLIALLAEKEDEELMGKDASDIRKMIEELES